MQNRRGAALLAALALLLVGCGAPQEAAPAVDLKSVSVTPPPVVQSVAASADFLDAVYHPEAAEKSENVCIDLSALADGYVAVSVVSESRLKFQVLCGEETYTYNLSSNGKPSVFPLSCGDGEYRFRVMENVVDSKYAELFSTARSVVLRDGFQPFLRPSDYVPYSASSVCVRKAAELAAGAESETALIAAVYEYICQNVRYDTQKAATVSSGYLPDPDETLQSGLGICFDYAALAAAMLRSQGIPTKEIFGYVSPNDLYHAWNMFYTAESGWVTVSFETRKDDWNRMDATFAANGADDRFIGDGSNYADLYCY